jgi:hypothetical protein
VQMGEVRAWGDDRTAIGMDAEVDCWRRKTEAHATGWS